MFDTVRLLKAEYYEVGYMGGLGCLVEGKDHWCGAGFTKMHLNGRGEVTPCMFLDKRYGDMSEDLEIINQRMLKDREKLMNSSKACTGCGHYLKQCIGDCLAVATRVESPSGLCWKATA
jgi:MoaA/NifB/PqqE/SkfB family radical SAM enzyme